MVELHLRGARAEGLLDRPVARRGLRVRRGDLRGLPVRLVRALPVEARDERLRVDVLPLEAAGRRLVRRAADEGRARETVPDRLPRGRGGRDLDDVDLLRDEGRRGGGRRVPVVPGLDAYEARPLPRDDLEKVRRPRDRRPMGKRRRRVERRVVVVGEVRERDARVDEHPVEAGLREGPRRRRREVREVFRVEIGHRAPQAGARPSPSACSTRRWSVSCSSCRVRSMSARSSSSRLSAAAPAALRAAA